MPLLPSGRAGPVYNKFVFDISSIIIILLDNWLNERYFQSLQYIVYYLFLGFPRRGFFKIQFKSKANLSIFNFLSKVISKVFFTFLSLYLDYMCYSFGLGSGLCIFSRHPILRTQFNAFSLNGYPLRLRHFDYFMGKGVGLAQLRVRESVVTVYTTHVHLKHF